MYIQHWKSYQQQAKTATDNCFVKSLQLKDSLFNANLAAGIIENFLTQVRDKPL